MKTNNFNRLRKSDHHNNQCLRRTDGETRHPLPDQEDSGCKRIVFNGQCKTLYNLTVHVYDRGHGFPLSLKGRSISFGGRKGSFLLIENIFFKRKKFMIWTQNVGKLYILHWPRNNSTRHIPQRKSKVEDT